MSPPVVQGLGLAYEPNGNLVDYTVTYKSRGEGQFSLSGWGSSSW